MGGKTRLGGGEVMELEEEFDIKAGKKKKKKRFMKGGRIDIS